MYYTNSFLIKISIICPRSYRIRSDASLTSLKQPRFAFKLWLARVWAFVGRCLVLGEELQRPGIRRARVPRVRPAHNGGRIGRGWRVFCIGEGMGLLLDWNDVERPDWLVLHLRRSACGLIWIRRVRLLAKLILESLDLGLEHAVFISQLICLDSNLFLFKLFRTDP